MESQLKVLAISSYKDHKEQLLNIPEFKSHQYTVVDMVMKSKLSQLPHNQYYPRVDTKKGY